MSDFIFVLTLILSAHLTALPMIVNALNKFKRKKINKVPPMVLEVFGHTDFKMLKQKILAEHLFSKMYFYG